MKRIPKSQALRKRFTMVEYIPRNGSDSTEEQYKNLVGKTGVCVNIMPVDDPTYREVVDDMVALDFGLHRNYYFNWSQLEPESIQQPAVSAASEADQGKPKRLESQETQKPRDT